MGSEISWCEFGSTPPSTDVSPSGWPCRSLGACRGKGKAVLHAEGTRGHSDKWQQGKSQLKQGQTVPVGAVEHWNRLHRTF